VTRRTVLALLWLVAAVLFAAAVILAPHAKSDATDDAFIATLDHQEGISYPSRDYAITGAKAICVELDSGQTAVAVAAEIDRESGLTTEHSAFLTGAAVTAYCPWHAGQILGQKGMRV
jgi:hypothetical protein